MVVLGTPSATSLAQSADPIAAAGVETANEAINATVEAHATRKLLMARSSLLARSRGRVRWVRDPKSRRAAPPVEQAAQERRADERLRPRQIWPMLAELFRPRSRGFRQQHSDLLA